MPRRRHEMACGSCYYKPQHEPSLPGAATASLQAARRHLRDRGLLAVVWTDRDLSSPFVLELEELFEDAVPGMTQCSLSDAQCARGSLRSSYRGACSQAHSFLCPGYSRYGGQHDAADWVARLQMGTLPLQHVTSVHPAAAAAAAALLDRHSTVDGVFAQLKTSSFLSASAPTLACPAPPAGGMFRLIDYSAFPHMLHLPLGAFLDELTSKGALHAVLGSSQRRGFYAAVRQLAEQHFGATAAGAAAAAVSCPIEQEGPGYLGEQQAAGRHPQQQSSRQRQGAQVCRGA